MGKFSSDFGKLCESWKHMSYNHYHSAWLESRSIVNMEAGDLKEAKISAYLKNHTKSKEIRDYLNVTDSTAEFDEVNKEKTFANMIGFFTKAHEKSEVDFMKKREKATEDHEDKEDSITGGN